MLVLVASALMVRRIPIGQGLKMMIAWVLIFGAAFIVFTLKNDFIALWERVVLETRGGVIQEQAGDELRVRQSPDGHFWVNAELNGEPVRFLIDSGATTTSISAAVAERVGIRPSSGFPAMVRTANGIVAVQRGRADSLRVGTIERRDVAVHISEAFGDMNVIGMNFLSTLSSWGVEGRTLILRP
ncbi:MAG: retroviral-like aspartic protease family protein [Pseudomonadota bacterium]|nr:retroviral-like aspartic protease family protein [Pseudomonadota bacterium]